MHRQCAVRVHLRYLNWGPSCTRPDATRVSPADALKQTPANPTVMRNLPLTAPPSRRPLAAVPRTQAPHPGTAVRAPTARAPAASCTPGNGRLTEAPAGGPSVPFPSSAVAPPSASCELGCPALASERPAPLPTLYRPCCLYSHSTQSCYSLPFPFQSTARCPSTQHASCKPDCTAMPIWMRVCMSSVTHGIRKQLAQEGGRGRSQSSSGARGRRTCLLACRRRHGWRHTAAAAASCAAPLHSMPAPAATPRKALAAADPAAAAAARPPCCCRSAACCQARAEWWAGLTTAACPPPPAASGCAGARWQMPAAGEGPSGRGWQSAAPACEGGNPGGLGKQARAGCVHAGYRQPRCPG